MLIYLKSIFQLILSPGRGWEDVARVDSDPRRLASCGLYPLIAVAAITEFAQILWNHDFGFISALEQAIITFVAYFAGYFIGIFFMSIIMPELSAGSSYDKRTHTFVNYTIGLLALIRIVYNLVPVVDSLIYFCTLYVAVIQWKGSSYMQVGDSYAGRFILITAPLTLLPPYLLRAAFNFIF